MQFALFFTGLLWLLAARTAAEHAALGLVTRFGFAAVEPVLTEAFFLFLMLAGFTTLHWIATRQGGVRSINSLPERETARREWLTGAALGWAILLAAVLPMMATGSLHLEFWLQPRAWGLMLLALATATLGTLAIEVAFRGYLFRRLIDAVGPVAATLLLSLIYAVACGFRPNSTTLSLVGSFLAGMLFSLAYLRTHGLWLGWGLQFGWTVSAGILFGLPVRGADDLASLVRTTPLGADWLSGGLYGPEGALFTMVIFLVGMAALYRVTRDYAWHYTHAPIVPGGVAVTVQPPAAHTAMEQAAASAPAPLVQIAAITPAAPSTSPEIEQHLRASTSVAQD